jgi:hypothetical protein
MKCGQKKWQTMVGEVVPGMEVIIDGLDGREEAVAKIQSKIREHYCLSFPLFICFFIPFFTLNSSIVFLYFVGGNNFSSKFSI